MWIQPNTTVKILRNVPLDNSYENTMWFVNDISQTNTFSTFAKYTFQNPPASLTYQRVNKNTIRINRVADDLYDCNYMMFQNTAYGTKWFYAFINQVNYINDNVTEVVYEIDDVQTWLGILVEGGIEECFIERQHAINDTVGLNIQPENIDVGEYFCEDLTMASPFSRLNTRIIMALAADKSTLTPTSVVPDSAANCIRSCFTGREYWVYANTPTGAAQVKQDINSLASQWADRSKYVESIFIAPDYLTYPRASDDTSSGDYWKVGSSYQGNTVTYQITKKQSGSLGGYTPRNNKLYTYPYNFLYATNLQGIGKAYPYEFFYTPTGGDSTKCSFEFDGDLNGSVSVTCMPLYYKGAEYQLDDMITASGYPQCAWNTDTYRAWVAQARGIGAIALGAIGVTAGLGALGVAGTAVAARQYNEATAIPTTGTELMTRTQWAYPVQPQTNMAMNVANIGLNGMRNAYEGAKPYLLGLTKQALQSGYNAYLNPIEQRGNQSGSSMLSADCLGFAFGNKHITPQFAARIDRYFDMYGYAQNIVGTPEIHVRQNWTYVKTIGCTIKGGLPVDAARHIGELFDSGIRFWTDITKVGDYTHNSNPPISA